MEKGHEPKWSELFTPTHTNKKGQFCSAKAKKAHVIEHNNILRFIHFFVVLNLLFYFMKFAGRLRSEYDREVWA